MAMKQTDATVDGKITKNVLYNFLGYAIPMFVAFITVPFIARGYGTAKFGLLSLVWVVIGYFNLFDLGLGRATTKLIADSLATKEFESIPKIAGTSVLALFLLGIISSGALAAATPSLVHGTLKIPDELIEDAEKTFLILSCSIPFVLMSLGARGILEAQNKFVLVNAVKIPGSASMFIIPLFVLPYSANLYHVVIFLAATRTFIFVFYLIACFQSLSVKLLDYYPDRATFKRLLQYGGWLTVSNTVSPLMTYMDRFIIASMIGVKAVAYYTTPYDLVTRLLMIPGSLYGALFPTLTGYAATEKGKLSFLLETSVKYLIVVIIPVVFMLIIFAEPFLHAWMGAEFAQKSTLVMQIISINLYVNALALAPFSAIQALGRPAYIAKLHLSEFPVYIFMIWLLAPHYGIVGVALAGLLRILIDAVVLYWSYYRMMSGHDSKFGKAGHSLVSDMTAILLIMVFVTSMVSMNKDIPTKIVACIIAITTILVYIWRNVMHDESIALRKYLDKVIRFIR